MRIRNPSRTRSPKRRSLLGWIIRILAGLFLFSVLWVGLYRFINPPVTVRMLQSTLSGHSVQRDWMPIREIDRNAVRAVIAAEDARFCQHNGFDFNAIEKAAQRNATGKRIRGGSTISQQTAKNAFLWPARSYVRKGLEAYFTALIELLWSKKRIMEVYLNIAETGVGVFGVNAGAQHYFGHDASRLSPAEAARLAAILPQPVKRTAAAPKGYTRRYAGRIQKRIGVVRRDGLMGCVVG